MSIRARTARILSAAAKVVATELQLAEPVCGIQNDLTSVNSASPHYNAENLSESDRSLNDSQINAANCAASQNYTSLNTESTHIDGIQIQQNLTSIPVSNSGPNNNPETLTENNGLNDNSEDNPEVNAESEFCPTPQNYTPLNNESNEYISLSIKHQKFHEAPDTLTSNLRTPRTSETNILKTMTANPNESETESEDDDDSVKDPNTRRKTETSTLKNRTAKPNESGTESEDDDDSIKDPNFESSSSSSSSSSDSSSSSSSSSSDEEIGREVLREIVATRNTEEVHEDLENNATNGKKCRKRLRNENEWNKNKIKRLRNSGKEYISSAKSKRVVSAKQVKESCGEKCQHQCSKKFDREQRLQLFNAYYSLENIDRKRDFLSKHMELITPKYRYVRAASNRRLNFAFYFRTSDGKKLRVCKKFFKNTLDINDRTVLTVRDKTLPSGVVSADGRGKHKNHKKISDNLKNDVRNHIQSIPRIESHYLRAQTSREFIDGRKTIADLYRDYKLACEAEGKATVNYHMYADIFNTEFNISFFIPKKDQCSLCFQYNTADEEGKENLKLQYDEHLKEKVLSRKDKEEDKAKVNQNFIVACFDMQAVLPIPKGDISIFYYKSKLNTMNLSVTEIGNDATWCYVWHEGEGGKGATEVGSCILKYLEEKASKCDSEELEIVLYSDNCGAQQKNRYLIALLMYAVQKYKIKAVTHKYLIVGHTQNEGDATHSVIEKQVTRALKSGPIFVPDQFVMLIRVAKKKGSPYFVKELSHDDFVDVKQLMADTGINFNVNTKGEQVFISNLRIVRVEKNQPFLFFYKMSYTESEEWKSVDVRGNAMVKKTTRRSESASTRLNTLPTLNKAYKSKLTINENKKKDLKFLLEKNFIPNYYKGFYESLF
ncbi:unnamed protein product [Ceutorhynchus assimilis]|uniref:DUF7869 domain-containing protein n=1 Tax=Ceutorhynchus assimilis TaxID=467358 RepID=A0A9N9MRP0_9CUCU|nr:unnamed protein product [Ceutorhynchus assimilis]